MNQRMPFRNPSSEVPKLGNDIHQVRLLVMLLRFPAKSHDVLSSHSADATEHYDNGLRAHVLASCRHRVSELSIGENKL